MPRRAAAQIRPVEADSIHRSKLVQQVINKVMLDGKKSTAERIVYDALELLGGRGAPKGRCAPHRAPMPAGLGGGCERPQGGRRKAPEAANPSAIVEFRSRTCASKARACDQFQPHGDLDHLAQRTRSTPDQRRA